MLLVLGIEIVLLVSSPCILANAQYKTESERRLDLLDMQTATAPIIWKAYCFSTRISPGFLLVSTKSF